MIKIAASMKVELFVGLSSRRCDLVEGERMTDETWAVLLLFTLNRGVKSRDRHMLRRLWASWALDGLKYVPAHDLISENTTLEPLSTYILLHFQRNMLNIHIVQAS